ncbi:MAG: transposase, partial [Acidobacteria bacterium]|nr:transposase [Acidobacteriota bacterium]
MCSLVDAVKQTSHLNSFVELSLAPAFRHLWHSIYAITAAEIDSVRLDLLCLAQVPRRKAVFYALDVMNVRRAESETLKDRVVCHGAKREAFGNGIVFGLPYSLLAFTENASSSWAMTVNSERVKPEEKAVAVAVKQIEWLFENKEESETSVGLDGGYGNVGFFLGLKGKKAFVVARMGNDRTLYRQPKRRASGRGNQAKYGEKFKFNEPESLGEAEETIEFVDEKHGKVRIEKWSGLRFRVGKEVVEIEAMRSQIHLEREKPNKPRWYGIHNGTNEKTELKRCYETVKHRWTIEPSNRFRKERLYVEIPKFREAESVDKWLKVSQIVEWETYLWREHAK